MYLTQNSINNIKTKVLIIKFDSKTIGSHFFQIKFGVVKIFLKVRKVKKNIIITNGTINFVGLSRTSNKKIVLIYIFYIFVNNTFTFRKFSFVLTQFRMMWGI